MPGSYLIDVERGIVFSRAWGALDPREVAIHAAALKADPRFDPGLRQIVDFREITELPVTTSDIRRIAGITPFSRDARRVFVVNSDEAHGLMRMFGSYANSSDDQFALFRTLPPAMEWVGLDPATPWPDRAPDKTFGEG